jgi:hypothetical protein
MIRLDQRPDETVAGGGRVPLQREAVKSLALCPAPKLNTTMTAIGA